MDTEWIHHRGTVNPTVIKRGLYTLNPTLSTPKFTKKNPPYGVDFSVELVYTESINNKGVSTMAREQAEQLVAWLRNSFLVTDGMSLETAAETYDEMNDNTEFRDALGVVEEAE